MPTIKVHKNKNYTVMSNYHFKEKKMSLKAKGLLSQMLSLPENWDYSIAGLVAINKENESAIKSTLDELKEFGYLIVTKLMPNETESGRIEYIYEIFEKPQKQEVKKQEVENLGVEFLGVENQGQYNTKELNTKELNTNNKRENKRENKKEYGEFKNVLLTDEEYKKIEENNLLTQIENLSRYIASTGKKYKSHYATILNWGRREKEQQEKNKYKGMSYRQREYLQGQELLDKWAKGEI